MLLLKCTCHNPWWQGGGIPALYGKYTTQRKHLFEIIKQTDTTNQATSIVGPRRTGKTVLIYQTIRYLLEAGVNPRQIVFLKADDPSLKVEENIIEDLIQSIEKYFPQDNQNNIRYIFLDEIQGIPQWAEYIKKYIDIGAPLKFVISGSASINIVKTTKESLSGRAKEIIIGPLSFREVFDWVQSVETKTTLPKLDTNDLFDQKKFTKKVNEIWNQFSGATNSILKMYEEYLLMGGFPYVIDQYYKHQKYDSLEINDYLKTEVIERALFRDIPMLTEVKNPYLLQQLFVLLSKESGSIFNLRELSRKLSISFQTVQNHLWYLQQSYLTSILRKYSRGGMSQARTQPKVYVTDTGIINSLNNTGREVLLDQGFLGRLAESQISSYLQFNYREFNKYYWRDSRGEIDFILSRSNLILPIEVKYRTDSEHAAYKGIQIFASKHKYPFFLAITQNEYTFKGSKGDFILIPAWLFCLLR